MSHQLTEIASTLREYREGLGNLTVNLEGIGDMVAEWESLDASDAPAWSELAEELAATSLAFQRHVDAAALLAKLMRRLPRKTGEDDGA